MWSTLFKIKKIFSKVYKGTSSVYESIYLDLGQTVAPIVMSGVNGIGGGNFGSYIDLSSKITNNTILDITSNSKDESFENNFNFVISPTTLGNFTREVTLLGCYTFIIDLYYYFTGSLNTNTSTGVYYEVLVNGISTFNSMYETSGLAVNTVGEYSTDDVRTIKASVQVPAGNTTALASNLCREYNFESPKNVKIIFYFNFSGYNDYMASPIEGVINVTSLKATNDITRDIYATVIEQVEPTIN